MKLKGCSQRDALWSIHMDLAGHLSVQRSDQQPPYLKADKVLNYKPMRTVRA